MEAIKDRTRLQGESKLILKSKFLHNSLDTFIALYSHYIFIYNQSITIKTTFNQQTAFDIQYQHNPKLILYLPDPISFFIPENQNYEKWEEHLIKFMKRKRFHELFKTYSVLGKGSFAKVYLSRRIFDERLLAIKAFNKQATFLCPKGREGLYNEINILRTLNSENIVKLEGVYETQRSIYVGQQYVKGKNLMQYRDQVPLIPVEERKIIMKQILNGLIEMQRKNIVHRDLKPENIMITEELQVKIIDLGLATSINEQQYLFVRCGTPGYISPQILFIKDKDKVQIETSSDMFSVGAIFYFLIFGKFLFEGQSTKQVLQKNKKVIYSIPSNIFKWNSNYEEINLLKKMIQANPYKRITPSEAINDHYFTCQKYRQQMIQIL